jgi:hypothetical protein
MARRGASVEGIAHAGYVCVNLKLLYNHHMRYCTHREQTGMVVHLMTLAKPNFSFVLDLNCYIILYCA